jgi:hypothetical protein
VQFEITLQENDERRLVELSEELRLPLDAYQSATECKIQNRIEMSNLNWKIILDEAFRSIKTSGDVSFEIREFERYDLRRLWLFLGINGFDRTCDLIRYNRISGNVHRVKIKVSRKQKYFSNWSICYISDGSNLDQIIEVGKRFSGSSDIEILVSGPKNILGRLPKNIIFIDEGNQPKPSMISHKKNLLVESAKNDNLLLLHDRYSVSESFFESFKHFGFDYGVAVPAQFYNDSEIEYPGLLSEENNRVISITQHLIREDFFVNGGCIVIKRGLALRTSLNSYLSWGEMEDIDWTSRLIQQGEIPRLVRHASIQSVGTNPLKTATIQQHRFDPSEINFYTELDCLLAVTPHVFFEQLPMLLETYAFDPKFVKRVRRKCTNFGEKLELKKIFHMTPLRFCIVLSLNVFLQIRRRPPGAARTKALRMIKKSLLEMYSQNKKYCFIIILVSMFRWVIVSRERKLA